MPARGGGGPVGGRVGLLAYGSGAPDGESHDVLTRGSGAPGGARARVLAPGPERLAELAPTSAGSSALHNLSTLEATSTSDMRRTPPRPQAP